MINQPSAASWVARLEATDNNEVALDDEALIPSDESHHSLDLPQSKKLTLDAALKNGTMNAVEDKKNQSRAADAQIRATLGSFGVVAKDQYGNTRLIGYRGQRYGAERLDSQACKDRIQAELAKKLGKPLGSQTLAANLEAMRGKASESGNVVKVAIRVADIENPDGSFTYHLDLGDDEGNMAVIGEPGVSGWYIKRNTDIPFIFDLGALPIPVKPTNVQEAFAITSNWLDKKNIPCDLHLIITVVIVDWLRNNTPHIVGDLVGGIGGGKTTLARDVKALIDPSISGQLPEAKLEEDHIAAMAQSSYILVIDNAKTLPAELQNIICKVCYGYEYTQRKMYTQDEVARLPIHNPVIITSVNPSLTQADAMNRSIRIPFKSRQSFQSQLQLMQQQSSNSAAVLGAILELLSAGLAGLDITQSSKHRMVDFALLGEAIATALGHPTGHFSGELDAINRRTAEDYAEGDELIKATLAIFKRKAANAAKTNTFPKWTTWQIAGWHAIERTDGSKRMAITTQVLFDEVRLTTSTNNEWMPKNPRWLTSALMTKTPILRDLGFVIEQRSLGGGTGRKKAWVATWK